MYGRIYLNKYYDALNLVDQLQVWQDILGLIRVGQLVSNPFRFDKNPGCFLSEYNGVILFRDFAYPEYSYTCVHAVAHVLKLNSLHTAASVIIGKYIYGLDINISLNGSAYISDNFTKKTKTKSNILYEPYRDENGNPCFIERDKLYWEQRGVTSNQLLRHNVFSVKRYFVNGSLFYPKSNCYVYVMGDRVKIYNPFDKDNKWYSTTTKNDIWCSNEFPLSNYCIITKSLKDLMVLENIIDCDIYAFQNEGVIPELNFFINHYDIVYILYDNDTPGKIAATRLNNLLPNSQKIFISSDSNCKDADEYYLKYGKNALYAHIWENINMLTESIQ